MWLGQSGNLVGENLHWTNCSDPRPRRVEKLWEPLFPIWKGKWKRVELSKKKFFSSLPNWILIQLPSVFGSFPRNLEILWGTKISPRRKQWFGKLWKLSEWVEIEFWRGEIEMGKGKSIREAITESWKVWRQVNWESRHTPRGYGRPCKSGALFLKASIWASHVIKLNLG